MKKPLALYIHWPFCRSKCPYCDFNSHVREGIDEQAWEKAMLIELKTLSTRLPGRELVSIFFGGGTPTLMPPRIASALIDEATNRWSVSDSLEITLEGNPTSVEAGKFAAFANAGVNRVSLGVQSLKDESLRFLGREHSASEALDAVTLAAKHFPRMSFDLIYALPDQSEKQWQEELTEALTFARGHLSLYQLTIEQNTAFHTAYAKGRFDMPEDELAAGLYELTQQIMEEAGMPAYEISNHAAPGQESRHNLAYWRGEEYLGIGPGAHGRIEPEEGTRLATSALKSPERWLHAVDREGHGLEVEEALAPETIYEEKLMMGLRLREGVARDRFTLIPEAKMTLLTKSGLLEDNRTHLQPTLKGRLLLNTLTSELLVA